MSASLFVVDEFSGVRRPAKAETVRERYSMDSFVRRSCPLLYFYERKRANNRSECCVFGVRQAKKMGNIVRCDVQNTFLIFSLSEWFLNGKSTGFGSFFPLSIIENVVVVVPLRFFLFLHVFLNRDCFFNV